MNNIFQNMVADERERLHRRAAWLAANPSHVWFYQRDNDNGDPTPMTALERELEKTRISLTISLRDVETDIDEVITELKDEVLPRYREIPWPVGKPSDYEHVMALYDRWRKRDSENR